MLMNVDHDLEYYSQSCGIALESKVAISAYPPFKAISKGVVSNASVASPASTLKHHSFERTGKSLQPTRAQEGV